MRKTHLSTIQVSLSFCHGIDVMVVKTYSTNAPFAIFVFKFSVLIFQNLMYLNKSFWHYSTKGLQSPLNSLLKRSKMTT